MRRDLPPAVTLIRLARSPALPSARVTRTGPQVRLAGAGALLTPGTVSAPAGPAPPAAGPASPAGPPSRAWPPSPPWLGAAPEPESRSTSVWLGPPPSVE